MNDMVKVVSNPTAGDVHVNTPLTNFSQKYLPDESAFIATRAMPNLPVAKQSDLYYEFNRGDFYRDEAEERADGTESSGSGFRLSTEPYFARVYAFHKDVTDRQRANQDSPVRLDESSTQFVTRKLMIRREVIFANTYISSGIWTTDLSGTGGDFTPWNAAGGDPIVDIRNGKRTVQQLTGYRPNKMIITRSTYDVLLDNDAILSRIIGGATTQLPALVMQQRLAELLEIDQIFVMDAVVNFGEKDNSDPDARDMQLLGGDSALLYYAPDSVGLEEPTAGTQFSWTGLMGNTAMGMRMKRFRMEHLESDRIEGQMAFDYKLVGADLGVFFGDTIAPSP